MERSLSEDFGPAPGTMQGNIRSLFEILLKTKYYRSLSVHIKAKKGLWKLLEELFKASLLDIALKPTLFDLSPLSNGPHDSDVVALPEGKLPRNELLPLIREALSRIKNI